jgi:acetyl-CoA acyltransferase 1
MTPPPSSQVPNIRHAATPRQIGTSLSSPPTSLNGVERKDSTGASFTRPSHEQLSDASTEELRELLRDVLGENERLELAASEARMSAAHYKLQHNLLSIEAEESSKRMEVEHDMTRREVDFLQYASQNQDCSPTGQEYVTKLKAYCQSIEQENATIYQRLQKAKKAIETRDEQLTIARDEKKLLLQRIRDNRQHFNVLRSPGGLLHVATPKASANSYPTTPQQHHATPKHTPMAGRSVRHGRDQSQEPFAALLLADRVLSQENNSAPSTPVTDRRPHPRTPIHRHNRGVQSLSSLPTTPKSGRPTTANSTLLPSVQFTPQAESRVLTSHTSIHDARERSRKSRDSTISASDAEEIAHAVMDSNRETREEIQESQASLSATEMLRIDPRESFEVAASPTTTPTPATEQSGLLQSKIFGAVSKPTIEKRKNSEGYDSDHLLKKPRTGEELIGLGIGFHARAD